MAQASDIRKHMEVRDSAGVHVGTVDSVADNRIKLTRIDSTDGEHHYVPLSSVARGDEHVHLAVSRAEVLGTTVLGAATRTGGVDRARGGMGWLPWLLLALALIALILLFRSCHHEPAPAATGTAAPATPPLAVEAVALPNGRSVNLEPNTLNYALQRYLASSEATPRTFTFDKLNFDTGSSAIRAEDEANVDALAQILTAYTAAKVKIVGYTDARGSGQANAQLGQQRADAVAAALVAKGADKARIEAASGGEANPADTNATAQGQFDNRRTELVVTAK